ncbi:MAG: hypothetical protein KJ646_06125 [Nanoarchaeota archaeon]|nr:hypothetical protein [Nanoarchaeota archaeon]MBU4117024.1 hypothetical protein [Nanoarchaeota archaeon]
MKPNTYKPIIEYSSVFDSMNSEYKLNMPPKYMKDNLGYSVNQSFHGKYAGPGKGDYVMF